MKILVIGAKGFIGSHVFSYFAEQNRFVFGYDLPADINIQNYFSQSQITLEKLIEIEKFDFCINAAGAASVPLSIENPDLDRSLNVDLVVRILSAIHSYAPLCKFINLSSAAVYGNPVTLPIDELHPINPLSPYGEHKLEAEKLCRHYYEAYGISTAAIRIFSAYGDGLQKQLFWDLYQKSTLGSTIELFGTGNESRDFIYVSDVAHAIACVMQKAEFKGESINLANGVEITIRDAAKLFLTLLEFKGQLNFTHTQRKGDPSNWVANIDQLKRMGYMQQVSFEQGLKKYIDWLRSEKK